MAGTEPLSSAPPPPDFDPDRPPLDTILETMKAVCDLLDQLDIDERGQVFAFLSARYSQ